MPILPDRAFIERISMKTALLRLRLDMTSSKTTINLTTQKKSGKEHDDGHRLDRRSGVSDSGFPRKHPKDISVEGAALRDNYKVCDKTNDRKENKKWQSTDRVVECSAVVLCCVSEHLRLFIGDELDSTVRSGPYGAVGAQLGWGILVHWSGWGIVRDR